MLSLVSALSSLVPVQSQLNLAFLTQSSMADHYGVYGLGIRQAATKSHVPDGQDRQQLLGMPPTPSSFSSSPFFDDSSQAALKSPSSLIPTHGLRTTKPRRQKLEWYSTVALYITGIYSTVLSGASLTVAIMKPHWGDFIKESRGTLTPTAASTLATFLAKSIEISFLTFCLAMLGQYLTRKASTHTRSGISLGHVQLKMLLVQPGSLFTQWKSYGRALRSFIGVASLIACAVALLYTTASEALGMPTKFFDVMST